MLATNKVPIAILGGGPSGLLLGRLLHRANIDFTIFERDERANTPKALTGGQLDIHTIDGQFALQQAGLLDQFRQRARYDAQTTTIANSKGAIVARLGENGSTDRPEIDRRDLRSLLLDSIPADKIRWGSQIKHLQRSTDGSMSIHFADGKVESQYRLVVGADGAWSKARSLVTSAKPQYSGQYYLTTAIHPSNRYHSSAASLCGLGTYMAVGSGKQLAAQRLGSDSIYIALGLALPERWSTGNPLLTNQSALRKWLLQEHFADFTQAQRSLIEHSEGDFYPWPIYSMPEEAFSWQSVPGVTLIGDAAHVGPPNGDGVNIAMYDSLQLAQQIEKYGVEGLDRAVAEYEKAMFPRARAHIAEGLGLWSLLAAPDAPTGLLQAFAEHNKVEKAEAAQ